MEDFPDEPTLWDIKRVYEMTRREHGLYIQPAELTLNLGKPFRLWKNAIRAVQALIPTPVPEPNAHSMNSFRYQNI